MTILPRLLSRTCLPAFVFGIVVAVAMSATSCSTSGEGLPPNVVPDDDNGGGGANGNPQVDAPVEDKEDGGTRRDVMRCDPPEHLKELGESCGCHDECDSGSCVDGVCCSGACDGTCTACNVPGKMGNCSPIPAGMRPVVAGQCSKEEIETCGFDGTCDGNGACRRYPDGTICQRGTCDGDTVSAVKVCTEGQCEDGENVVCTPYGCDAETSMCTTKCTDNDQCAAGQTCEDGSCGLKKRGAKCMGGTECESGFCTDGVCCTTECSGACVSCNQAASMGECTPTAKDLKDPHGICTDQGKESCGTSAVCDGKGGCAKYGEGTTCRPARCSGGSAVPASTCDGKGSCNASAPIACGRYACSGNTCVERCTTDQDCSAGNICQNGSCGLRGLGQKCGSGGECESGNCVDGVCCNEACGGFCRFCASPQAVGRCVNVGAGTPDQRYAAGNRDPAKVCIDQGPTSCGRNGLCNGSAGCQLYRATTVCKGESCNASSDVYSAPSTCDGAGKCIAGATDACSPYQCNGSRCGIACGTNNDCVPPNTCINGSCGKKPTGAVCSQDNECGTGQCEQGVCCATACTASCFSCALSGAARGTCTAVADGGVDPARVCKDQGPASCANDGLCNGSGACRKYAKDTVCAAASCVSGTETKVSVCNGTGTCVRGSQRTCDPTVCNAEGTACYDSCTMNNQCLPPNLCQAGGTCGKKPTGANCATANECRTGFCVHGFCCNDACEGVCRSCQVATKEGTCSLVGDGGEDPDGACTPSLPTACGNDGFCAATAACRKWAAGTDCQAQSCPAGSATFTAVSECNGTGTCVTPPPVANNCAPFKCDGAANQCLVACTLDEQCTAGNFCNNMSCGLKPNGAMCPGGATQCQSGKCVDGVCCQVSSCPTCQVCGGAGGTCQAVAADTPDPGCGNTSGAACGPTGVCAANGTCKNQSAGTGCGTVCSANNQGIVQRQCDGVGGCMDATMTTSCGGLFLCSGGACLTECTSNAQCVPGGTVTCQDINPSSGKGTCQNKRADGAMCTKSDDCVNGNCVGNICCATASCPACQSCGTGSCQAVNAGTADTRCSSGTTGNSCSTGLCAAGGVCEVGACPPLCATDTSSQARMCNGSGGCGNGTLTDCLTYKCNSGTGVCRLFCTTTADCSVSNTCQDIGPNGQGTCKAPVVNPPDGGMSDSM
jgi:hypothetical protein